jgi:hypothetical protein
MAEGTQYKLPKGFQPHLEIEVTFLRPEEGGGTGPWRTGYTPPLYYDGAYWIGFYAFSADLIHPGDTVTALVCFPNPDFHDLHRRNLSPGKEIELREGHHVIARGRVIRLLGLA